MVTSAPVRPRRRVCIVMTRTLPGRFGLATGGRPRTEPGTAGRRNACSLLCWRRRVTRTASVPGVAPASRPSLRAGDDLPRGDRVAGGERGGVAVVNDAGATLNVVPVQVAARGEDLQDAGLAGVADRHNPVGRGAAGAFDHRGALGEGGGRVDLEVADRTPGHAGTPVIGREVQPPWQAAGGQRRRERPR